MEAVESHVSVRLCIWKAGVVQALCVVIISNAGLIKRCPLIVILLPLFLWFTFQFIDWDYLRALSEVEKLNEEKKEKVMSHVKWTDKYVELLHFYSSCALCDSDGDGLKCQVCILLFYFISLYYFGSVFWRLGCISPVFA